jgi:hypothetical protein
MKGPPRRRPPAGTNWFGMKSSPGDSHHRAFDAPWGFRNTTVFSYPNPRSAVVAFRGILTQANAASFRPPGPPTTQTYGSDPAREDRHISRPWADISCSNVHGWARTFSIGFRRPPRRTGPIRMFPSSVWPAPGFISSTRKPASFWARTDRLLPAGPALGSIWHHGLEKGAEGAERRIVPSLARLKFTFVLFLRNGFRRSA